MKYALLALLLTGCATDRIVDLRPATIECLQEGKLLGAVQLDADGKVKDKACLAVRVERDS